MKTVEKGNIMDVQVHVENKLAHGLSPKALQQEIFEGLIIRRYLNAELSMGEVADILGVSYDEAHEWINKQGVATTRTLPDDLKKEEDKTVENLRKDLGIKS